MIGLIILTCRNNLQLTSKCFATLNAQTLPCRVLLVDNGSTDGTAQWAAQRECWRMHAQFPSVARMWNEALRWAWDFGLEEALVVNNDTELLPATFRELHVTAERMDPSPGMITCVSRRKREELVMPGDRNYTVCPNPDFSCFLIRKWAWQAVGGFDENCKGAYAEDCVFHVEAHRRGIRCVSINLPFLHHGASTVKAAPPEERKRIEQAADANREYFYRKYGVRIGTPAYDTLFTPESFGCYNPTPVG